MSRLSCLDHKSRVLVLETKTIHRSNGETCDSTLKIANKTITSDEVRKMIKERM